MRGNAPSEAGESFIKAAERQLVARELHDTTSQLLVALQLQLEELRRTSSTPNAERILNEMAEVIRDIHSSIRKIGSGRGVEHADADGQVKIARIFHSLATLNGSA